MDLILTLLWRYKMENYWMSEALSVQAKAINIQISTKNDLLDNFFQEKFSTHTGQWVHDHPELDKLKKKYDTHYRNRK